MRLTNFCVHEAEKEGLAIETQFITRKLLNSLLLQAQDVIRFQDETNKIIARTVEC